MPGWSRASRASRGSVSGRNTRVRGGRTARSRPLTVCGPGGAGLAGLAPPVRPWRRASGRNARVRGGHAMCSRPLAVPWGERAECQGASAGHGAFAPARRRIGVLGRRDALDWLVPRLPSASCVSGRNARGSRGRPARSRPLAVVPEASGRNAGARQPRTAHLRPIDVGPAFGRRQGRRGAGWPRVSRPPVGMSGRNVRVRGRRTTRSRPLADAPEASGRNPWARPPRTARPRPLAGGEAGRWRTGGTRRARPAPLVRPVA